MPDVNQDRVEFSTGLFGLSLTGSNALVIFLFIALFGLSALTIWSHRERSKEHANIVCMIKLNLYVNSVPTGEALNWSRMPPDIFPCVPEFLYRPERQQIR